MVGIKYLAFRVRKRYFEAIITGKKRIEYRRKSEYWSKRLAISREERQVDFIAVFLCGKQKHKRWVRSVEIIRTPTNFSVQGKLDVDTPTCFAINLGSIARRPRLCPACSSNDIGELLGIESQNREGYELLGGLWYCVSCGWSEQRRRELTKCFKCGSRLYHLFAHIYFCPKCDKKVFKGRFLEGPPTVS